MQACVDGAYDEKFEAEDIVPVTSAGRGLFSGALSRKDGGLQRYGAFNPSLSADDGDEKKKKKTKKIAILTATSGDTGKAALEGFADVEGTEIIVFFPSDGVSEVQKRQMTTRKEKYACLRDPR